MFWVLVSLGSGIAGYLIGRFVHRPFRRRQRVLPVTQHSGQPRRTWEEMDALKARMIREGFPLPDHTAAVSERVWRSLAGRIRREQLLALLDMNSEEVERRIREVRRQRLLVRGRK